ncbi:hypothetical protein VTJ83DRAFT_5784 [Remersonia thermophila]|uniref:Uncharacterized protein n=1 Tax=Remersonia thermophila TaxID=72144 RepID=A0ABR4DA20_9PEZI
MPKTREYHLSTSSGKDFPWLLFKTATPPTKSRSKRPSLQNALVVSRPKAAAAAPKAEEPSQALMAPGQAKSKQAAQDKKGSEAAKNSKPSAKKKSTQHASLWSAWYVSEDRSYLWRAKQTPNSKAWNYQVSPACRESPPAGPQIQVTTPTTSSSALSRSRSRSPTPGKVPGSLEPDPDCPKSSYPTILTTSTGQPTEGLSASSRQTLVTLPKEGSELSSPSVPEPGHDAKAAVTTAKPTKGLPGSRPRPSASRKRPIGPVARLLQEGTRSRRQQPLVQRKPRPDAAKSTIAVNTTALVLRDGGDANAENRDALALPPPPPPHKAAAAAAKRKSAAAAAAAASQQRAMAKKLHSKVRSEKEMKVDHKRRVKAWLKKVDVDLGPIPLDGDGLPVYR